MLHQFFKKHKSFVSGMIFSGVLFSSIFLFSGCSLSAFNSSSTSKLNQSVIAAPSQTLSAARNTPVVNVARELGPAVVGITNKTLVRDWFNNQVQLEQGVGSGVIFREDGYIVTNNHVIAGAREILVSLADGRTFTGKLVGTDEMTDIAVVKIDATGLVVAPFGNSQDIVVGEPAIAIGNPMGLEFQGSVTTGVISALNRTLDISERRLKLIQTSAPINPGNSGGALANADGNVIGIISAKIANMNVEGMGFAIPINTVDEIIKQLMENGRVIRPYLGASVFDKETALRAGYQLNVDAGVYVQNVQLGGPADRAGIVRGDVILQINGVKTNTVAELRSIVTDHQIGDTVNVLILRDGRQREVQVVLQAMPKE